MLDLSPTSHALRQLHGKFLDDDLPAPLSRRAFSEFRAGAYDSAEVARARRSWTLRALDEYRSLTAFSAMLADLATLDLGWDALGAGVRLVRDEDRHVDLCRRMVEALRS